MDYENKYKEALEIAQKLYQDCPNGKNDRLYHTTDLEKMFPELYESEDEKIRKELIEHVKDQQSSFISAPDCRDKYEEEENNKYNSWLAWLEKQGEQKKPADKIETKFKVGDWITDGYIFGQITNIDSNYPCYRIRETMGGVGTSIPFSLQDNYHLWTIQDAKPGDVLSDGTTIFIFKDLLSGGSVMSYCDYDTDSGESDAFCPLSVNLICSKITPATKEQRDLLFSKMNEAGYEWDFKKKELKKIEDEHQLKEGKFYECIKSYHYLGGDQYWFDKGSVYFCEKDGYLRLDSNNNIYVYDCKNWQNYFRPYAEKLAWSEEDESLRLRTIGALETCKIGSPTKCVDEQINWLKSLKQRCTWKPSDVQMEGLNVAKDSCFDLSYKTKDALKSLYKDLKKLK